MLKAVALLSLASRRLFVEPLNSIKYGCFVGGKGRKDIYNLMVRIQVENHDTVLFFGWGGQKRYK